MQNRNSSVVAVHHPRPWPVVMCLSCTFLTFLLLEAEGDRKTHVWRIGRNRRYYPGLKTGISTLRQEYQCSPTPRDIPRWCMCSSHAPGSTPRWCMYSSLMYPEVYPGGTTPLSCTHRYTQGVLCSSHAPSGIPRLYYASLYTTQRYTQGVLCFTYYTLLGTCPPGTLLVTVLHSWCATRVARRRHPGLKPGDN